MNVADEQPLTAGAEPTITVSDSQDREAFDAFFTSHGPQLYRYSRRKLANEADAADVVQATFVGAWQQLGNYRGQASQKNWLYAICSRKISDTYRAKRAEPIDELMLKAVPCPDLDSDPFTTVSNAAFIAELYTALSELPPRQRTSWVLREVESMSFCEVGETLGVSPDAARGHHRRATAALRIRMDLWR